MTVPVIPSESDETRIKRLKMRSMRRGIKEMDIILSQFAEANLVTMEDAALVTYDALLDENDQDLLLWVTGRATAPEPFRAMVEKISQTLQK